MNEDNPNNLTVMLVTSSLVRWLSIGLTLPVFFIGGLPVRSSPAPPETTVEAAPPLEPEEDWAWIESCPVFPSPDGDTDLSVDTYALREFIDLDGDGLQEVLRWIPLIETDQGTKRMPSRAELTRFDREEGTMRDEEDDPFFFSSLLLQVNGETLVVDVSPYNLKPRFIDIDTRDSCVEIVMTEMSPSDVCFDLIFRFMAGRFRFMGEFQLIAVHGNGRISVAEHGEIFPGWLRTGIYELTESHSLRRVEQKLYAMNIEAVLRYDLRLFRSRGARHPTLRMPKDTRVILTRTDDRLWIEVRSPQGLTGWVKVEDGTWPIVDDDETHRPSRQEERRKRALSGYADQGTFGLEILSLP